MLGIPVGKTGCGVALCGWTADDRYGRRGPPRAAGSIPSIAQGSADHHRQQPGLVAGLLISVMARAAVLLLALELLAAGATGR